MLILNATDVRQVLPMSIAIEQMKRAFAALSSGRAEAPLRARLPVRPHHGVSLVMPAFIDDDQGQALTVKVASLFENNTARGVPRTQSAVLVLEPDTGRPIAMLDGAALTALHTGAATGLATDLLARSDSQTVAVFGAGVQARTQLEAVCAVRSIKTAWVYSPIPAEMESFIAVMAGHGPVPTDLHPARTPQEAIAEADVICTATTSHVPVFADDHVQPGVHINAVGSYESDVREIPGETVARAMVVVDSRDAALAEAGDLIQPLRQGLIQEDHLHGELGELVLGRKTGRSSPEQITLFKAVGIAVQDAVAAQAALKQAKQQGLGQHVRW